MTRRLIPFKNLSFLVSGAAISQIIFFLSLPILTRFYSKEAFALFGLVTASAAVGMSLATLKYEGALVVEQEETASHNIFFYISIYSFLFSLFTLAFLYIFQGFVPDLISEHQPIINLCLAFLFFINAIYQLTIFMNTRYEMYKENSFIKILFSILTVILQFLFYNFFSVLGLILGYVLGKLGSVFFWFNRHLLRSLNFLESFNKKPLLIHKKFPLYNGSTSILDAFAQQMPIFFITLFFFADDLADFTLTYRVLLAPLALISVSMSQVFLKDISQLVNDNQPKLTYFITNFVFLTSISIAIFLPFILFGEEIFIFLYGETWRNAGIVAEILSLCLILRLIASSFSTVFPATDNMGINAIWKVFYFLGLFLTLYNAKDSSFTYFVWNLVYFEIFAYLVLLVLISYVIFKR